PKFFAKDWRGYSAWWDALFEREGRRERATEAPPARLSSGKVHRLNEGRLKAVAGIKSNPAIKLMTTQSSGRTDGHRPTHATATSTPTAAAAPGVGASAGSDNAAHGAFFSPGRFSTRLLSTPLSV